MYSDMRIDRWVYRDGLIGICIRHVSSVLVSELHKAFVSPIRLVCVVRANNDPEALHRLLDGNHTVGLPLCHDPCVII